ncbi:hypothetical protein C2845_PM05G34520 [Panicum miliaceum]|uniref:Exportin-1 C-terminal domain-containing protein n=1 Tax=Panicum miliaceum TaxID=4540 RepID=A0A3L6SZT5_PANMI|nr:hypothetical protein C2845_PM05G34520 [Panicum miliaceum]
MQQKPEDAMEEVEAEAAARPELGFWLAARRRAPPTTPSSPLGTSSASSSPSTSVKRETLKLIETFVDKAEDLPHIGKQSVPPMMDPVLGDYARNVPDARESEVLSLFATIIKKYKGEMLEDVPRIFEAVF